MGKTRPRRKQAVARVRPAAAMYFIDREWGELLCRSCVTVEVNAEWHRSSQYHTITGDFTCECYGCRALFLVSSGEAGHRPVRLTAEAVRAALREKPEFILENEVPEVVLETPTIEDLGDLFDNVPYPLLYPKLSLGAAQHSR